MTKVYNSVTSVKQIPMAEEYCKRLIEKVQVVTPICITEYTFKLVDVKQTLNDLHKVLLKHTQNRTTIK